MMRAIPGRQEVVVIVKACFDASFDHPKGITSIGGYMGIEDDWRPVEEKWAENLNFWGLVDFHLHELPHQIGRVNADLCALNFSIILRDSNLLGISAGINDIDWEKERESDKNLPNEYVFCLEIIIDIIAQQARMEFPGLPVHVFADRDASEDVIHSTFKRCAPESWSYTISHRRSAKAIQCADLIAGEQRLEWWRQEFGDDQFVECRRVLENASAQRTSGAFWSRKTVQQIEEIRQRNRASVLSSSASRPSGLSSVTSPSHMAIAPVIAGNRDVAE
jgi:hypothetical protein